MTERISPRDERAYWNALAGEYQRITRISTRDFHYGPQIPGERVLKLLPRFCSGMTALELGCGAAQNSIWLARQGVKCTAMDVSAEQLAHGAELARENGVAVDFIGASLENFQSRLKGVSPFDFVHSSHAMEFVDRPGPVVRRMAAVLKPGGTLMISTVHPLYNGSWVEGMVEDDDGKVYDGQFLTDYFSPPDDVRDDNGCHAVSRAWPVSSWFNWIRSAGLELIALAEPPAVKDAPYTSDDWANHGGQLNHIPSTLILVARNPLPSGA